MHRFTQVLISVLLLTALLAGLPERAFAQNACSQTLIQAQIAYYEGRANDVPTILNACIKSGFTRDEKVQAYRLLILTYLYLNEFRDAENTMLYFLRLNPDYQINEAADPAEFINLYNQFRTWPVYLFGAKAGGNVSFARPEKPFFSTDNPQRAQVTYESAVSYQAGLAFEIPLNTHFMFSPEINIASRKYRYQSQLFGYESLVFREEQNRIELPLLVSYQIGQKRFSSFVKAGLSVEGLFRTVANVRRVDNNFTDGVQREVTGPNVDLRGQRKKLNSSAVIGIGIKFKKERSILMAEVRYQAGLFNPVKAKERYSNAELLYRYGYVDSNYRLNSLSFVIGYIIPVYRPKLLPAKRDNVMKLQLNQTGQ